MQSLKMPRGKKCSLVNICFLQQLLNFSYNDQALDTKTKPFQCSLETKSNMGCGILTYFIVSSDSNNSPRIVANSWGKKHWPGTKDISVAIGCNDPTFVNFLEGCLRWDKNQRLSPDELMQHSWIVGVSIFTSRLE
jgi:serine/threonine protein kinase